ncbi:transcriptional regulator, Crp/Fnr family [Aliiroseovarius crassostreae]|uniref:Crp/Fnr family transcriptional regulator n=1 Tax=Aliiroseovarius crassostreae TaxID=154981 RepID=A0A0P7I2X5_9RHOB|nr:Crp/Fnr family transcriptional regulator [Aliiroseovarius crassostreae]KPN63422.1 hypothetical protein AKJ29_12220 [Aliiroseovarius crassostreae]SFU95443.1 transcriptional regulator, Crp/Fnr family [Aliiroseovarius crassostreae]
MFADLPAQIVESFTQNAEIVTAPKGRLIVMSGDQTTDTYFLISGSIIGQIVAQNGREILFNKIGQGGYFGELAALDGAERSITISAQTDCVLAKLRKEDFLDLLNLFPQVAINLARDLAERLRHMNERVFGLIVHDVETRLRIRLMQLAQEQEQLIEGGEITDMPTHEVMAGYVGSNREAVSRAVARLSKAGVIETTRKKVVIRDLNALLSAEM